MNLVEFYWIKSRIFSLRLVRRGIDKSVPVLPKTKTTHIERRLKQRF